MGAAGPFKAQSRHFTVAEVNPNYIEGDSVCRKASDHNWDPLHPAEGLSTWGIQKERTMLMKVSEPRYGSTPQEDCSSVRSWRSFYARTKEIEAAVPDPTILPKALEGGTHLVSRLDVQATFRFAQARSQLQVDSGPDEKTVWNLSEAIQPIIPLADLTKIGIKIQWEQNPHTMTRANGTVLPVRLDGGCPVIPKWCGDELTREVEDYHRGRCGIRKVFGNFNKRAGAGRCPSSHAEQALNLRSMSPHAPDRIATRILVAEHPDMERVPFNIGFRRRVESASTIVLHLFSGPKTQTWITMDEEGLVIICDQRFGLERNSAAEQQLADDGAVLWLRTEWLIVIAYEANNKMEALVGQPQDPGTFVDTEMPRPWMGYSSFMAWPETNTVAEEVNLKLISFDQGRLHHKFTKPTMTLTNVPEIEFLNELRMPPGSHTEWPATLAERMEVSKQAEESAEGLATRLQVAIKRKKGQSVRGPTQVTGCHNGFIVDSLAGSECEGGSEELLDWTQHVDMGHMPYRRDCMVCVQNQGRDRRRKRVTAEPKQKSPSSKIGYGLMAASKAPAHYWALAAYHCGEEKQRIQLKEFGVRLPPMVPFGTSAMAPRKRWHRRGAEDPGWSKPMQRIQVWGPAWQMFPSSIEDTTLKLEDYSKLDWKAKARSQALDVLLRAKLQQPILEGKRARDLPEVVDLVRTMQLETTHAETRLAGCAKLDEDLCQQECQQAMEKEYPEDVLITRTAATEEVRRHIEDWVPALKNEYKSLLDHGATKPISREEFEATRKDNRIQVEVLPALLVATQKPPRKLKARVVVCGNYAAGVGSRITAVQPPQILKEAEAMESREEQWQVTGALYGLIASPKDWGDFRNSKMEKMARAKSSHGASSSTAAAEQEVASPFPAGRALFDDATGLMDQGYPSGSREVQNEDEKKRELKKQVSESLEERIHALVLDNANCMASHPMTPSRVAEDGMQRALVPPRRPYRALGGTIEPVRSEKAAQTWDSNPAGCGDWIAFYVMDETYNQWRWRTSENDLKD
eukprot:symbB.v1.2.023958.t1/scaffold2234.1/size87202/2